MMTAAVLAVQGAFLEHETMLKKLGADCLELRRKADLERSFDCLILPGGESTAMGKLLRELDMLDTMRERILSGLPVYGTCAGMILLAKKLSNDENVYFGTMDITVRRNAYGRQLGSFQANADFNGAGKFSMTFIRAPFIEEAGEGVEILSRVNGKAVAARQGNQLVTAFHPELTDDTRIHEYFLEMVKNA